MIDKLAARASASQEVMQRLRFLSEAFGEGYSLAKPLLPPLRLRLGADIESPFAFWQRLATVQPGYSWQPSHELDPVRASDILGQDQLLHPFYTGQVVRRLDVVSVFNSKTKPLLLALYSQRFECQQNQAAAEQRAAKAAERASSIALAKARGAPTLPPKPKTAAQNACPRHSGKCPSLAGGPHQQQCPAMMLRERSRSSGYHHHHSWENGATQLRAMGSRAGQIMHRRFGAAGGDSEESEIVGASPVACFCPCACEAPPIANLIESRVILKAGDDVRQDEACLQIFRVFNHFWARATNEHGKPLLRWGEYDGSAKVYHVLAMSPQLGLIECVDGCVPIKDVESLPLMPDALDRLVSSAACSYIAGFVLGLRDRHHDNLLISEDGTLFHVDFGFILNDAPSLDTHPFAVTKGTSLRVR